MRGMELGESALYETLFSEFNAYQMEFDAGLQDRRQRLRSSFLQFVVTFMPELVPAELLLEISQFARAAKEKDNYDSFGWFNNMPLEVALYTYRGGGTAWIEMALGNISHHSGGTRDAAQQTLALAIPQIDAFDPVLLGCIERSIEELTLDIGHIALFASADGEPGLKRKQLEKWVEIMEPNAWGTPEMKALASGEYISNPFAPWFRMVERYAFMRAYAVPEAIPIQVLATGSMMLSKDASTGGTTSASVILDRIEKHPLSGLFIELGTNAYNGHIVKYNQNWRKA